MPIGLVLRRLAWAAPTLVGVLVVVFALLRLAPGDPVAMMIGPGATQEDVRTLRALYGLDRSLPEQFALYARDVLVGDLGRSISLKENVGALVAERLPMTMELAALAMLMATGMGFAAALAAALWRGRWPERAIDAATGFVTAIPDFLWALAGILAFGVLMPVLPVFGLLDADLAFVSSTGFVLLESLARGRLDVTASALEHLLMPALALALPLAAMVARVLKASLLDAMAQDWATIARVKGFSRRQVLLRHALRNALSPALTLTGVQLTFLIGGTVLIERIFGLPGIGSMAIDAVINRDLPLIQGIVLTFAALFVVVNLLVDLANAWLDPRQRSR